MGQKIRQHLTKDVPCPTCGARRGNRCKEPTMRRHRDPDGKPATALVRWMHHARRTA